MAFEYTTGCEHGRADERRNIVAALRRKARAHERLSRILIAFHGGGARTEAYHEGAADALEAMAERIERGET